MRVLALTRYSSLGPSSRVRFFQYFPALISGGVELTVAPFLGSDYVRNLFAGKKQPVLSLGRAYLDRLGCLLKSHPFDLLWIEKELFPWLPTRADQLLLRPGMPCVVDYDDAIFHRYDQHPNPLVRVLLGKKIDGIMRHAATVVVGNDYLAGRARLAGASRIELLPSVIDLHHYTVRAQTEGQFRIGWIGSPVTAPYLKLIRPALEEVLRQTCARLVLVGAGDQDPLPGLEKEILPWSEENGVSYIQSFDVGIMPLLDEPFERGKCGYKLIQYLACGLPVVASPVGVNNLIVEQGKIGFKASNNSEWIQALLMLSQDPQLRHTLGQNGRQAVEMKYCLQVTAPRLLKIFQDALLH